MPNFPIIDTHLHVFEHGRLKYTGFEGNPLFARDYHVEDYQADCGKLDIEATRLYRENFHDWVGHLDFRVTREPAATVRSDNFEVGLRRGWVTSLQIHRLASREMVERLVASPGLRMLQTLEIRAVDPPVGVHGVDLREAVWKSGLRKLSIDGWYCVDPPGAGFTNRDFLSELSALEALSLGSVEAGVGPEMVCFPAVTLRSLTAWFTGWPRIEYLLSHSGRGSLQTLEWSNRALEVTPRWPGNPFDSGEFELSLSQDDSSTELAPMPREVDYCPWTLTQLVALFESPRYRDIRDLRLSLDGIGDILPEAVVRSGLISKLEELRLVSCGITDAGAVTLIDARKHPSMKVIDLRGNPLTPAVTDRIRRSDTIVWEYAWQDDDDEIPF